ncbi:MAG TPA: MarR family transcriptional regulator [Polyangiaceae bacterium]|jgi:DNA-binding MarR family transcriptional regulator|nr:MarR family transcriptional regulator [Polyangiaceae bacterium]
MSRADLNEFLAQHTKGMTAERQEIVASIIDESRRMSTRTVVFHAAIAERLGLNPSDHKCADLICNETGPVTAGRLAELTGLSTGAITGVIDRLERAGFVSRVPDPEDRRRVVIHGCIEQRAADMRHLFLPMMAGMVAVCENYSDAELALVVDFMRRSGQMSETRIQALREASLLPARLATSAAEPSAPPSPAAQPAIPPKTPRKSGKANGVPARKR